MPDFGIFRGFNDKLFGDKLYAGQLPTQLGLIGSQASVVGLLAEYPGAAAAYSLRQLTTAYTGSAIRVRRTNLDEMNIGFTSTGALDTTSLLAFTGTGALDNGFITEWYDQSGNARNATQAAAAPQPQIVSSGSVILENTKPAIRFNVSQLKSIFSLNQTFTRFVVMRNIGLSGTIMLDGSSNDTAYLIFETNNKLSIYNTNYLQNTTTNALNARFLNYSLFNGVNSQINVNGSATTDGPTGTQSTSGISIGSRGGGGFNANMTCQELIVYPSNQSSNRVGIETNINSFYSIY